MKFPSNLQFKLDKRQEDGSLRSLTCQHGLIDFSSNDYLGFAKNPIIFKQVQEELNLFPPNNGSAGSRLLTGNFEFHEALETQLAKAFHADAALLFNSGYDANIGLLSSVPQRGDCIFYDESSHASIRDGIRLSNAKSYRFKHNDLGDLEEKLEKMGTGSQGYLIVESVYSMDGDAAPLAGLVDISKAYDLKLIVDEAHSTGIYGSIGQGMVNDLGLSAFVFARIYTFGKALGCHGAAIAGDAKLIQYLINFARSFIYTTAMPLHNVLAVKNALLFLESTEERLALTENIAHFREMIIKNKLEKYFIQSSSPIQSAIIASNKEVKRIAHRLNAHKFDVKPILSPTVPEGQERIRFCVHSYNTSADIQEILFLLSTFV